MVGAESLQPAITRRLFSRRARLEAEVTRSHRHRVGRTGGGRQRVRRGGCASGRTPSEMVRIRPGRPVHRRLRRVLLAMALGPSLALSVTAAGATSRPLAPLAWHAEDVVPALGVYLGQVGVPHRDEMPRRGDDRDRGRHDPRIVGRGRHLCAHGGAEGHTRGERRSCLSTAICYAVTANEEDQSGFNALEGYWILKSTDGGTTWKRVYEDSIGTQFGSGAVRRRSRVRRPRGAWQEVRVSRSTRRSSSPPTAGPRGRSSHRSARTTRPSPSSRCPADAWNLCRRGPGRVLQGCRGRDDRRRGDLDAVDAARPAGRRVERRLHERGRLPRDRGGRRSDDLYSTTDLGATWSAVPVAGGAYLSQVTCVSAMACFTVGSSATSGLNSRGAAFATSDGGTTWSKLSVPTAITDLSSIACSTATSCAVQGTNVRNVDLSLRLHGTSISPTSHPYQLGVESIDGAACPTPSTCMVAVDVATGSGQYLATSTASQARRAVGSVRAPARSGLRGLPHVRRATALRGCGRQHLREPGERSYLDVTSDGGRHWAPRLSSRSGFGDVSCGAPTTCVAETFSGFARTTDGGVHWLRDVLPSSESAYSVSCPTARLCVAAGVADHLPVELRSTDGGASWVVEPTGLKRSAFLSSVACTSTTRCVVIGATSDVEIPATPYLAVSVDGGRHWRRRHLTGLDDVSTASCSDRGLCVAEGLDASGNLGLASPSTAGAVVRDADAAGRDTARRRVRTAGLHPDDGHRERWRRLAAAW